MTAYDREYRELDRLKGVSLKDDVLLYKITPEIPEGFYWAPVHHVVEHDHVKANDPTCPACAAIMREWPPHVESPVLRITEAEPGKVGRGLYIALVAAIYVAIPVLLYWLWRLTR